MRMFVEPDDVCCRYSASYYSRSALFFWVREAAGRRGPWWLSIWVRFAGTTNCCLLTACFLVGGEIVSLASSRDPWADDVCFFCLPVLFNLYFVALLA